MGRRALRKPDPSIDTSAQLRSLEELPEGWDVRAFFGRQAALEVELGSGKGLFLRTAAAACPDVNFLGLEISKKYARHAAAVLAKRSLRNAAVVAGDGLLFFERFLADGSVSAVHVYFPDPWWKKRHRRRRVMRESFLRDVERVLRAGGRLHFWTDVEEYFLSSLELMARTTTLQGPIDVAETPASHDMDYRTHFERRTRLDGEAVYRAEFFKPSIDGQPSL